MNVLGHGSSGITKGKGTTPDDLRKPTGYPTAETRMPRGWGKGR